MIDFNFCSPTEIVFGNKAEENVGKIVKKNGGSRVLLVYGDHYIMKNGLLNKIEANLRKEGISSFFMGGILTNPSITIVREMIELGIEFEVDFVIAIGGGNVIEASKAVAHGIANPEDDLWDYWTAKKRVEKSLPIGCILTVSAFGSESNDAAVLMNDELDEPTMRAMYSKFNTPRFALLNPKLAMEAPKWRLVAGAADVFMCNVEKYFTMLQMRRLPNALDYSLLRTVFDYGMDIVEKPDSFQTISELMWCGSVSNKGKVCDKTKGSGSCYGDWACNQLGMAISAIYDYDHVETLTAIWGAWSRYVLDTDYEIFTDLGRKVFHIEGEDEKEIALHTVLRIEEFFRKLGMPTNLTELLGYTPSINQINEMVKECSWGYGRSIGILRVLSVEDIRKIYMSAV